LKKFNQYDIIDVIKRLAKAVWSKILEPVFISVTTLLRKIAKIIKKFLKSVKNLLKDSALVVYNHFVLWAKKPRQKEQ